MIMYALIPAPADPAQWQTWREQLQQWRTSSRALLNFNDALYRAPEFDWIARTFNLGFLMLCDQLFYDGDYQLDAYLKHGEREFGGYDALILWHAYPRIGFDDRNQFDFYRQMPGGLPRLRQLVDQCHARGIRVYIDYNPWDTGTRREGQSDIDLLVDLVKALDADAIFLDTMAYAARGLREKLDSVRPGVTLESESLMPLEYLDTQPSSWAQGFEDAPGVLRNKWFERRHMQHRIRRWDHDHTPELHTAWMNGTGMVIWENVFGTPILWNERDKSILRAMVGIQRRYADLFSGEGWTPLIPTLNESVHASLWEDDTTRLWTLVNNSESEISGDLLEVPHRDGDHYYDLIRGVELSAPQSTSSFARLSAPVRPRGVSALLSVRAPVSAPFLQAQAALDSRANFDPTPPQIRQIPRLVPETKRYSLENLPSEMVAFPAFTGEMPLTLTVRECGFLDLPGITYPSLNYENLHRPFSLNRPVSLSRFALDLTPVTNAQFAEFLSESSYVPAHPENFLAHWHNGFFPRGHADYPVVYVSLEDARAYAEWAGKRLPTEEEWQFAAQGIEGRRYSWGDVWQPNAYNHGQFGGTTPVKQFEQGRTPEGIYDLCGNVWEWTESERSDGRTRFALLKGGSFYRAIGSEWYADGGAQPNDFAAKFLLMYPGLDRCATIGFRCAVDLDG